MPNDIIFTALLVLTALLNATAVITFTYTKALFYGSSDIYNVIQCSRMHTYSITYIAAVTSAMLLNAAATIFTALLILVTQQ